MSSSVVGVPIAGGPVGLWLHATGRTCNGSNAKRLNVRFTRCFSKSNGSPVRLASSLAAALLEGLFEHPAGHASVCALREITSYRESR